MEEEGEVKSSEAQSSSLGEYIIHLYHNLHLAYKSQNSFPPLPFLMLGTT